MLKKYLILSVLALFGLIIPQTAQAQIKNVSGRILEKHIGNKGRNLPFEEEVHVLAYNTVEAARRELEKLKQPGASAIMAMDHDVKEFLLYLFEEDLNRRFAVGCYKTYVTGQFVERAVNFHLQVVFFHTFASYDLCCAIIAAACIDFHG